MSEELKQAGSELANIAFNLAQKGGQVLAQREADLLKAAQRKWDSALSQPTQPAQVAARLTGQHFKAIAICMESCRVSISEVQRKLEIRWSDAQRLCQEIVDAGFGAGLALAPQITPHAAAPTALNGGKPAGA